MRERCDPCDDSGDTGGGEWVSEVSPEAQACRSIKDRQSRRIRLDLLRSPALAPPRHDDHAGACLPHLRHVPVECGRVLRAMQPASRIEVCAKVLWGLEHTTRSKTLQGMIMRDITGQSLRGRLPDSTCKAIAPTFERDCLLSESRSFLRGLRQWQMLSLPVQLHCPNAEEPRDPNAARIPKG